MEWIPLGGDIALVVESGGKSLVIPRPICERFLLVILDHGADEADKLTGVLTLSLRLGEEYVQQSLDVLNARRASENLPAFALPSNVLYRVAALIPAPIGSPQDGGEPVDILARPGEAEAVQFKLGYVATKSVLALIQAIPNWTPQISVSALLRDPLPLGVRTSSLPMEVVKQSVKNVLLVTLPPAVAIDSPDFIVTRSGGDLRYIVPDQGLAIDILPPEPFDYRVEWAAEQGVTNIVSGVFEQWSSDEASFLQLPVSSPTVKIGPDGLDEVGTTARLFLLTLCDSGDGLRLAIFADEDREDDVVQRILSEAGTRLTHGVLIGFDDTNAITGTHAVKANDVVGFPTVSVTVLEADGELQALLLAAAEQRWRRVLLIAPGSAADVAYLHYAPQLLAQTYEGLDASAPPELEWLAEWAERHNRSIRARIEDAFPLLAACARLPTSPNAAEALARVESVRIALADTGDDEEAVAIANAVLAAVLPMFVEKGFSAAVVRICVQFPGALAAVTDVRVLLAVGAMLEEPRADFLDRLAFETYSRVEATGDLAGKVAVGRLLVEGRGVEADLARAEALFRDAVALPEGAYRLGLLLVAKDDPASVTEGTQVLEDAASRGSSEAAVALGRILATGEHGVAAAPAKARVLFGTAAEQGNIEAKGRLGLMLRQGLGGPVDNAAAAPLLLDAALGGFADAAFAYAEMLAAGDAFNPEPTATPERFFRLAARQNHELAMTQALLLAGRRIAAMARALATPASEFQGVLGRHAVVEAQLGDFARAQELATALLDASDRWTRTSQIVEIAAKRGHFELATEIAETIDDGDARENAKVAIVYELVDAGRLDEATSIVDGLSDGYYRDLGLTGLAEGLAAADRLADAKAAASGVADPFSRQMAFVAIAAALSRKGNFAEATAIVVGFDGGRWLVAVVWAQFNSGDEVGAMLTAAKITDDEQRARAYGGLARQFVDQGLLDRARDMALLGAEDSWSRASALFVIIRAYALTGAFDKAKDLLDQIPAGEARNGAAGLLGVIQAKAGQVAQAQELVASIPEDIPVIFAPGVDRAEALGIIAEIRMATQGIQAALDVVELITDDDARGVELFKLARKRADLGDAPGASTILEAIPLDSPDREQHIHRVMARADAAAGRYPSALDHVNAIDDGHIRASALVDVIRKAVGNGEFVKAKQWAETLADDPNFIDTMHRSTAFHILAISMFQAGLVNDALDAAASIPSEQLRGDAWSEIRQGVLESVVASDDLHAAILELGLSVEESKQLRLAGLVTLARQHFADHLFASVIDELDQAEAVALTIDGLVDRVVHLTEIADSISDLYVLSLP
jgi:TPR repeat protein/tetratricopeptide (TPR) repeat protein